MPEFLLEYLSEEIPARMQSGAARDLERLARERLAALGLAFDSLAAHAGPRRLTLVVEGLPAVQPARIEEKKGPRTAAPDTALAGFLRANGAVREELVERDGVYFLRRATGGGRVSPLLAEMAQDMARSFPWPKSMLSGDGRLRWVRPLRRLLCLFDGAIVPFTLDGLAAGEETEGHRFMGSRAAFKVSDFDSYRAGLEANRVILEADRRRDRIRDGLRQACEPRGLEPVEDHGLLEEVTGMVEWPVALLGDVDPDFLDLPAEVIRTSMRVHQRYFATRRSGAPGLAPHFVVIANLEASDGGATIVAGAARVLAARLADARFFLDEDRRAPLAARLEALAGVTFHAKLGSLRERVTRIEAMAVAIAPFLGADAGEAATAARLAKADLATAMVKEFPELQGVMGAYYAEAEGRAPAIVGAIREHYRPLGPSDRAPSEPVAMALALADKLDLLTGFFEVGEKPTGSRDPFALRRAALGIIRIVLESGASLPLRPLIAFAGLGTVAAAVGVAEARLDRLSFREALAAYVDPAGELAAADRLRAILRELAREGPDAALAFWRRMDDSAWIEDVLGFVRERLKIALREEGLRPDVCEAAFAGGDDDLARLAARARALQAFLATDDGANLLAGDKRAGNILDAERRKGALARAPARVMEGAPAEEVALIDRLAHVRARVFASLARGDFARALTELAGLREPVDAFFDKVLVNAEERAIRDNRLALLSGVRAAMREVADFSRIGGAGEGR